MTEPDDGERFELRTRDLTTLRERDREQVVEMLLVDDGRPETRRNVVREEAERLASLQRREWARGRQGEVPNGEVLQVWEREAGERIVVTGAARQGEGLEVRRASGGDQAEARTETAARHREFAQSCRKTRGSITCTGTCSSGKKGFTSKDRKLTELETVEIFEMQLLESGKLMNNLGESLSAVSGVVTAVDAHMRDAGSEGVSACSGRRARQFSEPLDREIGREVDRRSSEEFLLGPPAEYGVYERESAQEMVPFRRGPPRVRFGRKGKIEDVEEEFGREAEQGSELLSCTARGERADRTRTARRRRWRRWIDDRDLTRSCRHSVCKVGPDARGDTGRPAMERLLFTKECVRRCERGRSGLDGRRLVGLAAAYMARRKQVRVVKREELVGLFPRVGRCKCGHTDGLHEEKAGRLPATRVQSGAAGPNVREFASVVSELVSGLGSRAP